MLCCLLLKPTLLGAQIQDPKSGDFVKASSVQLRGRMRVSDEEAVRKACFEVCAAAAVYCACVCSDWFC